MTIQTMPMYKIASALLGLSSMLAACSEFEIENETPVARAQLIVNSQVADLKKPIPYMGSPLAVVFPSNPGPYQDAIPSTTVPAAGISGGGNL